MATIFSKIIAGEIPSYKIAETDTLYAFLDISPVQAGHTLIVPKREVDYFFDLSDSELAELMAFSKKIAEALKKATGCVKVGVTVIGLEVPHAHLHLVPMNKEGDLDFRGDRVKLTSDEYEAIRERIISFL